MQKSEADHILECMDEAIDLTMRIREELLNTIGDTSLPGQLYDRRGIVLGQLAAMKPLLPASGDLTDQWNIRAARLVEADTDLFSVLGVLRDTYQEKMRETIQRKYLLIYSKGHRYGS